MANWGAMSFISNAAERKGTFTLRQDPQFTIEQSQMVLYDLDTHISDIGFLMHSGTKTYWWSHDIFS